MSVQVRQIVEKFPDLLHLLRGASETLISDLQSGLTASEKSLIFVSNRQHFKEAVDSLAQAWVVHPNMAGSVPSSVKVLLTSPNPYLAMAMVGKSFFPQTRHHQAIAGPKIHPSAHVSPRARLGADCLIGPGAVIGDDCEIGDHVIIGANSVIEPGVRIGDHSHIHPLVFIGHSCQIGERCEIHPHTTIGTEGYGYAQDKSFNHHRVTHYGRVILEDGVHVGAGVQIDRGTFADSRIGAGTKIDNHCHFGHNIVIGKNTLITGGMITAGSTTIGSHCVFGGRTTIAGHLSVTDGCQFSGLSGITRDVTERGEYGGFPLKPIKAELRTRSAMLELPELAKQLRQVLKHLGIYSKKEAGPT